jgi:5'-nucleotidase
MAMTFERTLVIGISATALFDMSDSDKLYKEESVKDPTNWMATYRKHMQENEDKPLHEGIGFPLIKALLTLNTYQDANEPPLVEVVVMSRNSPETGVRVLNAIRNHGLNITRSAFTAGESSADYLEAFGVDLFLTTNENDAQKVIDNSSCASAILSIPPKYKCDIPDGQVRIAFDGDAVIFDEESELVYKKDGMAAFHERENQFQNLPMNEGPFAKFLIKLSKLQERLPMSIELSPVRIAIVTARNSPAELRVIKTLRSWGVYVDEALFLGGVEKSNILKAFRAHIFFDDQDIHLEHSSNYVPCGKVLYKTNSPLNLLQKDKSQEACISDKKELQPLIG